MSQKIEQKDKYKEVEVKNRKSIIIDNFIGGISWGLGSVIGATIIVGILGLIIVNTKRVPIIGDAVKVIVDQVENGIKEVKDGTK
jgi:hypothetical protein